MKRSGTIEKKSETCLTKPVPRLLTLAQAADFLGLSVWAMRERIWNGDIPVIRFPGGRKMFIDSLDIESFLKSNKQIFR